MKNFKKIVAGVLVLALVSILTFGTISAATAPSSITVKRAEVLNDIVANHDHGFTIFTTNDEKIIYCMDVDKKALTSGQVANLVGNGDAGLLYILQNGYPNKSITGNIQADKYITQAAVWWYLDEGKLSNDFKNATTTDTYKVIPKIKALVSAARSASDNQAVPSISLNASSVNFSLTSDGKYYESSYMSATVQNAKTYSISLTGGTNNTVAVNASGSVVTSLNSAEKFKVRVPASEVSSKLNITVKVATSGNIQKAKIYSTGNSAYQRVAGLYEDVVNADKSAVISLTPSKKSCEYVDGKYYGKEGNVVDQKTYNKECGRSCEYVDGKYYDKEGNVVNKKTYNEQCGHVCEYVDGKYYGKDGDVVGKKTFDKECNKTCQYSDGKYYGNDGKEVDENTYNKECGHVCVYTDDKYYGNDGKEVDEKTFNKQCKHVCEYNDGYYYGANGSVVSKTDFNVQCGQEVIVPNTSSNVSPLAITLGILLLGAGAYIIISRRNLLA